MLAARVALSALAVIACAWFALGARAALDQQRVAALLRDPGRLAPGQAVAARRDLDRAATLNPDRGLELLRAEIAQRTGRVDEAVRILQRVVRSEPRDIFAWLLLFYAAQRRPQLSGLAMRRVRALAPHVPAAP